jgi:hypothetical protein
VIIRKQLSRNPSKSFASDTKLRWIPDAKSLRTHVVKLEILFAMGNCTLILTTKFFPGLSWRSSSYNLVERTTSERNEEENGSNFQMIQEGETEIKVFVAGCIYDVFCSAT